MDRNRRNNRVERLLARGAVALAILLVVSQIALQFPALRAWLTPAGQEEGIRYPDTP
jgi:hypothetical protein